MTTEETPANGAGAGDMGDAAGEGRILIGVQRVGPLGEPGAHASVRLPGRLVETFSAICELERQTQAELFERLLLDYLDKHTSLRPVFGRSPPPSAGTRSTLLDDLGLSVRLANVLQHAQLVTAGGGCRFGRAKLRALRPPSGQRGWRKYFTLKIERELDRELEALGLKLDP